MEKAERRYSARLEARAAGEGSSDLVLAGYAAVFDVEANMYPGCVEVFRKGAFAETLQRDEIRAYWCHEDSMVLARTSSGTLSLSEDDKGLLAEIRMANTVVNQNYYASVQRGDVKGMSIGFMVQPDGQVFSVRQDGTQVREITRVVLIEVSPHPDPQYTTTELEARAKAAWAAAPGVAKWEDEVARARATASLMAFDL